MFKSVLLSGALALSLAASASAQPAAPAVKNVVLVHGAFADGSGWRGVYEQLTARGYKVSIVQSPLTKMGR